MGHYARVRKDARNHNLATEVSSPDQVKETGPRAPARDERRREVTKSTNWKMKVGGRG